MTVYSVLWLIIGRLYLSIHFTRFTHAFTLLPSGNHTSLFTIPLRLFSVLLICFFFFFKIPHINENIQYFVLLCLTNFTLPIILQFHPCFAIAKISFFYSGLPLWLSRRRIYLQCGRPGFNPWVGKIPWKRERLPTPVFWPGEFHGLYSPWGRKESDMTEWLSLSCGCVIFCCIYKLHLLYSFTNRVFKLPPYLGSCK